MFYGFFRGIGEVKVSIILTVVSQGIRVVLAYGLAHQWDFQVYVGQL